MYFFSQLMPLIDTTHVNLNYICGRTLLSAGSNSRLTNTLTDFFLRLLKNSTLVGDQRVFNTVQKFKRLNQQSVLPNEIHNVPAYSLKTISNLAEVLYSSMLNYRLIEYSWLRQEALNYKQMTNRIRPLVNQLQNVCLHGLGSFTRYAMQLITGLNKHFVND